MADARETGFFARAGLLAILAWSLAPCLLAAAAVFGPDILYVNRWDQDLLYNLDAAWRILHGQVPHVDFHEPVGRLNFLLTLAGFHLVGFSVFAYPAGELLILAPLAVMAALIARDRLPLGPAVLFTTFVALPALLPGEPLYYAHFQFTMGYNRFGWSGLCLVWLALFTPPGDPARRPLVDLACVGVTLLGLFLIKITYFLTGMGALALALVGAPHVRRHAPAWAGLALLVAAYAAAPVNGAYWRDVILAITTGNGGYGAHKLGVYILRSRDDLAIFGTGIVVAILLWRRGLAPATLPLGAASALAAGALVMNFNSQTSGIVLGHGIAFALIAHVWSRRHAWSLGVARPAVLCLSIAPLAVTLFFLSDFAAYWVATRDDALHETLGETNARALALRHTGPDEIATVTYARFGVYARDLARHLAASPGPIGKVAVLEMVNPLPFMLGTEPPRAQDAWWEVTMPLVPPEDRLGDADVLARLRPDLTLETYRQAFEAYEPYIDAHFPVRETAGVWMIYRRQPPGGPSTAPVRGP